MEGFKEVFTCENKCDNPTTPNEDESDGNWEVYDLKCKCGGQIAFSLEPEE